MGNGLSHREDTAHTNLSLKDLLDYNLIQQTISEIDTTY